MKNKLLFISLTLFSVFLLVTPTMAKNNPEQNVGPYLVNIGVSPEKPVSNSPVTLTIVLKNRATGERVTNATIAVDSDMPGKSNKGSSSPNNMQNMPGMDNQNNSQPNQGMQNMPNMNHMSYTGGASVYRPIQIANGITAKEDMEPGMYMVTLTPAKPGTWKQSIMINSWLGNVTLEYPLKVSDSGPNWILITSVAGIVVLAGILANILKRRKATTEVE
ncbi:MAG: hypothetical protein ACYCVD_10485 [Desulfitobacteriaceae bacterium]